MKKLALFCLLLVTIFTSCKHRHNIYYHHFNQQLWSYTDFWKKGTYWIMLDSASGQLDSLFVYDDVTGTGQDNYSEASDTHVWDGKIDRIVDYVGLDTFSYMGLSYSSWDYENSGITSLSFGFSRQDTIQSLQFGSYGYSYQGVITVPLSISNNWHSLWYSTNAKHPILGLSCSESLPIIL